MGAITLKTPLPVLPVEEKINVFVPLVFSLDYSRNASSIISYLSARGAFSFQTDAKKTTPVSCWRPSSLCTKDPFTSPLLSFIFPLCPCDGWIAQQSWPHFKRRRMGTGSGGLMNDFNSIEAHMATINAMEEALSRFAGFVSWAFKR